MNIRKNRFYDNTFFGPTPALEPSIIALSTSPGCSGRQRKHTFDQVEFATLESLYLTPKRPLDADPPPDPGARRYASPQARPTSVKTKDRQSPSLTCYSHDVTPPVDVWPA